MSPSAPLRLDPLLRPDSVAVIGASGRAGRPGFNTIEAFTRLGFPGRLYAVNPGYDTILGQPCVAAVGELPEAVDLAVVAGSSARMEGQVADAIAHGARSLMAFANARSDTDLRGRIGAMAREAGVPLLGPYTIGYVNYVDRVAASWVPPDPAGAGNVAFVIQSGSTYSYANILDPRVRLGFTVHPGQEVDVGVADLVEWILDRGFARVIGLYLEAIVDADRFVAALERADRAGVPVVVLKPGRSARARAFIATHAGRLAIGDRGFDAVCRRHGVIRAETSDAWWSTVQLLAHDRRPGPGDIAAILDSGGQRAVLSDHAAEVGVRWTAITTETRARVGATLDPSIPPDNPVDAWDGNPDFETVFRECFAAVVADPGTALGIMFTEFGASARDPIPARMGDACAAVAASTDKPVVAATYTARHLHPETVLAMTARGIPVLDGGHTALVAVSNAFRWRDHRARTPDPAPAVSEDVVSRWRERLQQGNPDEAQALAMLADFGVPANRARAASGWNEVRAAAAVTGYPVAIKTAGDVDHKTEVDGVRLAVEDEVTLRVHYDDLAGRLGPEMVVAPMARPGVELAFGMFRDADFGPLVVVGAGGRLVEVLDDAVAAVPPFGAHTARGLIEELRVARLLHGARGRAPADIGLLARALAHFSVLTAHLGAHLSEADVNPVIAGADGCMAVDALFKRTPGAPGR